MASPHPPPVREAVKMSNTIPFDKETIMEYLDRSIKHWRSKKKIALDGGEEKLMTMAACYIDAFQSVRSTIFGELLPKD